MSATLPAFILGYHGCRADVAEAVLAGEPLRPSENDYDWLGHALYFWEQSERRAWGWSHVRHPTQPAVVGAVVDLGRCLNLLDAECLEEVQAAHRRLEASGVQLPQNSGADNLVRRLDCAVINSLHDLLEGPGTPANPRPYQRVRAMFQEGKPLYPGAGFSTKNHIQVCVRDVSCLRGFFRPLDPEHPARPVSTRRD